MSACNHIGTVIFGLGKTGYSCVEYFHRRGEAVAVVDHQVSPTLLPRLQSEFPGVPFFVVDQAYDLLLRADRVMISPGVCLNDIKSQFEWLAQKELVSDVELFCQQAQAPIVAITGSNGKTTVTTLVGRVIEAAGHTVAVCGNIGEPVLSVLNQPIPDYYVLELSSFQLEMLSSLRAAVAVVLNIEPDHMDRYDSFDDYVNTKQCIYTGAHRAVINLDQDQAWCSSVDRSLAIGFSIKQEACADYWLSTTNMQVVLMRCDRVVMSAADLSVSGHHHWQNALAVLALTESLRLPEAVAVDVLREFAGLEHRCQMVALRRGVYWINDSKATNVGATVAAIKTLNEECTGRLILIAGGLGKGADFSSLREVVARFVHRVILIGKDAHRIGDVIRGAAIVEHSDSLEEAVIGAAEYAQVGDVVALSPACASFDMFDNYEHRGNEFIRRVEELI